MILTTLITSNYNPRTKSSEGKTAARWSNDAESTSKESTELLKDASPMKYAWPVATFTQARSLLGRTRSPKPVVAQDLERRSSRFPVYAECNGVHVNKNKCELSFRKCPASIGDAVFI